MNYFYKPWSADIMHVYASELPIEDIKAYLSNNMQRSLLSYEPPEFAIYVMGSLTTLCDEKFLAERCKGRQQLESWSIQECKDFLEKLPTTETIVNLSPKKRGHQQ